VILSRTWSVFLVLAGVFNWVVWPRFAVAIWNDPRAWSGRDRQLDADVIPAGSCRVDHHGGHHRYRRRGPGRAGIPWSAPREI
jgi:hypothetical protein